MADPRKQGRMIRKDICRSSGFAELTPKSAVLFCLLIPNFDSYGKMNGEPHFIKGEVCPLVRYFDIRTIRTCLEEISEKTNVKWFMGEDGTWYIHSVRWEDHQEIRADRRGADHLPSYNPGRVVQEKSGRTSGEVLREVEGEVQGEVEGEGEGEPAVQPAGLVPYFEIIGLLNKMAGRNFKATSKAAQSHIRARWKEGHRFKDFEKVITDKVRKWGNDPKMCEYLRPETLFGTKFDSYLQAAGNGVGKAGDPLMADCPYPIGSAERDDWEREVRTMRGGGEA